SDHSPHRDLHSFPTRRSSDLAYYGLGRVRESAGQPGAEEMYLAAVAHAPDLLDARLRLGRLLRVRGELQAALEHLLHAHRLNSRDRKSTRLNSSHVKISYAVF